ncbi:MAG: WD40/YVTN/BNR-like repeat-containing protein [Anaerolineae bacterium]
MMISTATLSDNKTWESIGPVAKGGTVYSVAVSPVAEVARCWAATGCGIFFSDDLGETWIQSLTGLTTPLLGAIAVSNKGALIAGSLQGEFFTSFDYGESWASGIVPAEAKGTITGLAISPNYQLDACAFASTDGAGLLVTRSSGHLWEDSSFGLGNNIVLAVATTPDWSHREMMFAATTDGVFVSMNGGRAWRETELMLSDDAVDVIAVSPNFEDDHTIFAGTENGSLYCSTNNGRTWDIVSEHVGDGPINCLWLDVNYAETKRILAGVSSDICLSEDGGESWKVAARSQGAVMSLAGNDKLILAGLQDDGVLYSHDNGATWKDSPETLSARGFSSLTTDGKTLFALGPQEGILCSTNAGKDWSKVAGLDQYLPLTTMLVKSSDELLVASHSCGLLRTTNRGNSWESVCQAEGIRSIALAPDGSGLVGTANGDLYLTKDGGMTWQETETPASGQEILAITFSPTYAQDHTILMGTAISATSSQQARIALWRTTNSGTNWRQLTTQVTTARWLDITLPIGVRERVVDQAIMATGPFCLRPLRRAKDVWISTRVDPSGTNALSVVSIGEIDSGGTLFVGTGNGVFRSIDGGRTWHAFLQPDEAQSFISLTVTREETQYVLYALSLGGRIYRHPIA